jgi:hypothetical protein
MKAMIGRGGAGLLAMETLHAPLGVSTRTSQMIGNVLPFRKFGGEIGRAKEMWALWHLCWGHKPLLAAIV